MKIFTLPSHATKERVSGVDYARVISPMKNLNGYKGIETFVYDPRVEELHNDFMDWIPITKKYDIIYFNYLNNPWGFAAMGSMARGNNCRMVMDIDDNLWELHTDNPAYSIYHKGSQALNDFTSICNEVDYITCTSDYLKHVIMDKTTKSANEVFVFPNYIDLNIYRHVSPFKDDGSIRLTHFGSSTHLNDLETDAFFQGVDRIMKEYPNVQVRCIGAWIKKFRYTWGPRFEVQFGHVDLYKWVADRFPQVMDETDILLTPLVNDVYNMCKSPIKWLEASSAKIPGVWQNIRQYREVVDGKNGFLVETANEWYDAIKTLIEDKKLRKEMGEKAYADVKRDWQIKDHLEEYKEFFDIVLRDGGKV